MEGESGGVGDRIRSLPVFNMGSLGGTTPVMATAETRLHRCHRSPCQICSDIRIEREVVKRQRQESSERVTAGIARVGSSENLLRR